MERLETVDLHRKTGGDKGFEATPEELHAIMKRMDDPEFRRLWEDYASDLMDPKYREEEEAYLRQVEEEAKAGGDHSFQFILPREAFVVRLAAKDAQRRVYFNICTCDKVGICQEIPSNDGSRLSQWHIPVSVGPGREELYNKKCCYVYDTVFHSRTLQLADRSPSFLGMIISVAIEHVNVGYKKSYPCEHQRLSSTVQCIGRPKPQTVRVATSDHAKNPSPTPTSPTNSTGPGSSLNSSNQPGSAPEVVPTYRLLYREKGYDFLQAWAGHRVWDNRIGVPSQLVLKVEIPKIQRASDLDVDVLTKEVLFHQCPGRYAGFAVSLPFAVDPDKVKAKFEANKKVLTIVMDVAETTLHEEVHQKWIRDRECFAQEAAQLEAENTANEARTQAQSGAEKAADPLAAIPCPEHSTVDDHDDTSERSQILLKECVGSIADSSPNTQNLPSTAESNSNTQNSSPHITPNAGKAQTSLDPEVPSYCIADLQRRQDAWLNEEQKRVIVKESPADENGKNVNPENALSTQAVRDHPGVAVLEEDPMILLERERQEEIEAARRKSIQMEKRREAEAEKERMRIERLNREKEREMPLKNKLITLLD